MNKTLHLLKTGLLATLFAVTPLAAQQTAPAVETAAEEEEPRRYRVEFILFRYAEDVGTGNERFLPDPPPDVMEDPALAADEAEADNVLEFGDRTPLQNNDSEPEVLEEIIVPSVWVGLSVLGADELALGDIYKKLQRLDAYEPLLWSGWTQAAVERERSPVIALRRFGDVPAEFDGSFQLYLSRYLHLVVDLEKRERDQAASVERTRFGDRRAANREEIGWQPDVILLRIEEDRIFRNGELRYFDHPKFGLLAKVSRVEEPVDDAANTIFPAR